MLKKKRDAREFTLGLGEHGSGLVDPRHLIATGEGLEKAAGSAGEFQDGFGEGVVVLNELFQQDDFFLSIAHRLIVVF